MALIDKETIRAEIERYEAGAQSAYNPHDEYADFYYGKVIACEDLLSALDTMEQPVGKTCKTCGFYENNCPFIRDKFIPYPNKVCKDYTYSVMKAQEQPVEGLEKEIDKWMVEDCGPSDCNPYADHWCADDIQRTARHFAEWGAAHAKK